MHIGIFGLSGSGKTYLRKKFLERFSNYFGISASQILRDAGVDLEAQLFSKENLDNNQHLLLEAYEQLKLKYANTFVELHAVVEGEKDLYWVPSEVLKKLGLDVVVFLSVSPSQLYNQRMNDLDRARLKKSISELKSMQDAAIQYLYRVYGSKLLISDYHSFFCEIEGLISAEHDSP